MTAFSLPTNVDSTYADSGTDASVQLHQQHHDTLHRFADRFDDSSGSATGQVLYWNGSAWIATRLDSKYVADTSVSITPSGATVTLDGSLGVTKIITLNQNITIAWTNINASPEVPSYTLVLQQDATGGRTVTWPSGTKWNGGTAPTLSTAANAIDIISMFTIDGGATWFGMMSGKGMA